MTDNLREKIERLRRKVYIIIFHTNTRAGKIFDISLLVLIILSVVMVSLESFPNIDIRYENTINNAEWFITICFTIEYILRIFSVNNRRKYIFSFYGIIDFLSILPSFLGLFIDGTQYLMTIRMLRLLRMFRVFQLTHFVNESNFLIQAFKRSLDKILVFMNFIFVLVIILGTLMYVIESGVNPSFANIPQSIYWAIVTITTVGYGDITPITVPGRTLAAIIMLLGYAIIAVPTGIITTEIAYGSRKVIRKCTNCGLKYHEGDAKYCRKCGARINNEKKVDKDNNIKSYHP